MKSAKFPNNETVLVTMRHRGYAAPFHITAASLTRIKPFLALSRTVHTLVDMATPVLAALLCLGTFPPAQVLGLGILTAFAGYTSVYALNDLVDWRTDMRRFENGLASETPHDIDSLLMRHPIASGRLSLRRAVLWTSCWMLLTLIGAYILNPFCLIIFVVACLLEILYCLAWNSTWSKVVLSGAVKTSSAVAAVYAVDAQPSYYFLIAMFLWLFFWEIGGQNIPNDWADIEEDKILSASTIPVIFGQKVSAGVVAACLVLTVVLSGATLISSPVSGTLFYAAAAVVIGFYLLILPGFNLCNMRSRGAALTLFNRASYYPVSLLAVVIAGLLLSSLSKGHM